MSITACPHCSNSIPPEFTSMPICYICGGDLNAVPAEGAGWASIDVKVNNSRVCTSCNFEVKSVLAMECPSCGAGLEKPGQHVEDIEKEKRAFEDAVTASQTLQTEEVISEAQEEINNIHPETSPETMIVDQPAEAIKDVMPEADVHPVEIPMAEVISELDVPPVIHEEPVAPPVEKAFTPPVIQRSEPVKAQPVAEPEKKQEGFFTKLLRMLGLKKD